MSEHVYLADKTDEEFRPRAESFEQKYKMTPHYGGEKTLDRLQEGDRLYLLCHGHGEMPLFVLKECALAEGAVGKRYWSAEEMAEQLQDDGLPEDVFIELELLVCHAGESVATLQETKQRLDLFARFKKATQANNAKEKAKLEKKYAQLTRGKQASSYDKGGQTFPLGMQLYRELYLRGYKKLRVIAYKAPVAQLFDTGDGHFRVHLDLKAKELPHNPPEVLPPDQDIVRKLGRWDAPAQQYASFCTVIDRKLFMKLGWLLENKPKVPLSCW